MLMSVLLVPVLVMVRLLLCCVAVACGIEIVGMVVDVDCVVVWVIAPPVY